MDIISFSHNSLIIRLDGKITKSDSELFTHVFGITEIHKPLLKELMGSTLDVKVEYASGYLSTRKAKITHVSDRAIFRIEKKTY